MIRLRKGNKTANTSSGSDEDDEEITLDKDFKGYVPTDSEEDYTEAENKLLAKVRKNNKSDDDDDSDEDVYGILSSDQMDSDLDKEDEDVPNVRAWGKDKKRFYATDYVDQDFGGFTGKDAEDADYEEKEARDIQQRLAKSLDDTDFSFDLFMGGEGSSAAPEEDVSHHMVKSDLSTLTKRQRQALFHKESPEFASLVEDMKDTMTQLEEKLEPFLKLVKSGLIAECDATKLVDTKYHLTLNYVTNITFYLLLKARRRPVRDHPIIPRLVQYRQLLHQIEPLWSEIVEAQVDQALALHEQGKLKPLSETYKTKRLGLLTKGTKDMNELASKKKGVKALTKENRKAMEKDKEVELEGDKVVEWKSKKALKREKSKEKKILAAKIHEGRAGTETGEIGKRGITRQIQKNKGLTPRRKKEQRNPRVKNRNKYLKAVQKRKGQVRTVRKELTRYGGEDSGIKPAIRKGIKLKV